MLIITGEKDHITPRAIQNAIYKKQQRNEGVTEIAEFSDRGHALTIDGGWREVADTALAFVKRFVSPQSDQKEVLHARPSGTQSDVGAPPGR